MQSLFLDQIAGHGEKETIASLMGLPSSSKVRERMRRERREKEREMKSEPVVHECSFSELNFLI